MPVLEDCTQGAKRGDNLVDVGGIFLGGEGGGGGLLLTKKYLILIFFFYNFYLCILFPYAHD
jgi:hypothetical protein